MSKLPVEHSFVLRNNPKERAWRKKSMKFAEAVIREKVDLDGKFVFDAQYEVSGVQLRGFLAYAYRCGQLSKSESK